MDAHKILIVAEQLSMKPGEHFFRSAVSRAYYAAFIVADQFLNGMDVFRRGGKEGHVPTHDRLQFSADPALIKVGRKLGTFHTHRISADYQMDDTSQESKQAADAAVALAKELIAIIDACQRDTPRWKQVKNAIKTSKK